MADTRLIERWLPTAALGVESVRERTPMTPFPAPNRLHVWWARRPLVASRAAVLASLLPADADRGKFLHAIGIHGDPVAARRRIDAAKRSGQRVDNPYGYERAYGYSPAQDEKDLLKAGFTRRVLDPTAGGGSIPFESVRLGLEVSANDLNPVAALIMRATVEWPSRFAATVGEEFRALAATWRASVQERLEACYPQHGLPDRIDATWLWARTVRCPYCEGVVPLSPNWRLGPDGAGVRLRPGAGTCSFEIVGSAAEHSAGTVARGAGACPYPECGRVIDGDEIKRQAQAGGMGAQLYAVVFKERVAVTTRTGRVREKWVRGYRAPRAEDDNGAQVAARLAGKLAEWEAFDVVPGERVPDGNKTTEPQRYGMAAWRDLFSPRQLLCHGTGVEVFREMLEADREAGGLSEVRKAAYGYLSLSLSKMTDWNSSLCTWHPNREVIGHTFQRHDFAFKWSYAEMAPLVVGLGYDWVIGQTAKCIGELVALARPDGSGLFEGAEPPPVTITCKPGDALDHVGDASIDAVVMDPPYYDNVMYAELSDFFYVWLKRTAGRVFPELFRRRLTDKDAEAVANPARFRGEKGARALAGRDYQDRMASIFAECRRVLKPDGILTLMFTHKAAGAWDALATGLMEAGFAVTASWPVNTEAEGSLHVRDKAAANSTIFLACRPRAAAGPGEEVWWEDVEPRVARAVRARVAGFRAAGIGGVDLFLAAFGPALEEFSRHWPLRRGAPREAPQARRRQAEAGWDPYAATPEDALDAARREVKRWRLDQLTRLAARAELDAPTAFFVLAWDAFRAPVFAYDEALMLARAVGVDLDREVVGRLAEKKGGDLRLWDSARRAAKGALGPADGARGMIDAVHHAANAARSRTLAAARELVEGALSGGEARFLAALEAVLEVLPVSRAWTGVALAGEAASAGDDFEALENLRRLAFAGEIAAPRQLEFWSVDR